MIQPHKLHLAFQAVIVDEMKRSTKKNKKKLKLNAHTQEQSHIEYWKEPTRMRARERKKENVNILHW